MSKIPLAILIIFTLASCSSQGVSPDTTAPEVIFKFDDYGPRMTAAELAANEILFSAGAVPSLGIITSALDDDPQVIEAFLDVVDRGGELWFHGHTHEYRLPHAEFSGSPPGAMHESIAKGRRVFREKLGMDFVSFGAPGNENDESTAKALANFPEVRNWFHGLPNDENINVIPGVLVLEDDDGHVLPLSDFKYDFEDRDSWNDWFRIRSDVWSEPYSGEAIVLQGHPYNWNDEDLVRLADIVDYLKTSGCRFTTARDLN